MSWLQFSDYVQHGIKDGKSERQDDSLVICSEHPKVIDEQ